MKQTARQPQAPPANAQQGGVAQSQAGRLLFFQQQPKSIFPQFKIHPSTVQLAEWLHQQKLSFAISLNVAEQAGKLLLLGTAAKDQFSVSSSDFRYSGTLALSNKGHVLCMSDKGQLQCFENSLEKEQNYQGYDACFLPNQSTYTGMVGLHDAVFDKEDNLFFISTVFSSVATRGKDHHMTVVWEPKELNEENEPSEQDKGGQWQLTGLALRNGKPRYVTAIKKTQDAIMNPGVVIDIKHNKILAKGLSMPSSPRWHNHKLWLINAGSQQMGTMDIETGTFTPVYAYQGHAKSLRFHEDMAMVVLNQTMQNNANLCVIEFINVSDLNNPTLQHTLQLQQLQLSQAMIRITDLLPLTHIQRPYLVGMHDEARLTHLHINKKPLTAFYAKGKEQEKAETRQATETTALNGETIAETSSSSASLNC